MRLAVLVVAVLAGCGGAPPVATPADAMRAHVALAELDHGRTLLVAKCGNCHRPPLPHDHPAVEWPARLGEMSERAGLDDPQRHVIEAYLVTMAER